MDSPTTFSLAPWLSVKGSLKALDFYKSAFGATEAYRMDVPDGVVARLSIHGADFWLSDAGDEEEVKVPPIRMILTVPDPDASFAKAVAAGATVVYAVEEAYGWRIGRIVDPFGHHWEIGKPL